MVGSREAECPLCGIPLVINRWPTVHYNQLVITMQTPEGATSTHEMLMCTRCREAALRHPITVDALAVLYAHDVLMMTRAHVLARGGVLSPVMQRSVDWLTLHVPIAARDEEGSSVKMLRAKGVLP